jgi:predicted acylesterase/phospholipase RssA
MGVSAGALYSMCLAAGYTIAELREFTSRFNFQEVTDPDVASGWLLNLGFDTGNRLQKLVNAMLHEKGYADTVTFGELKTQNAQYRDEHFQISRQFHF